MPAITPGRFIPIAFANRDGSNGERGSRHTLTGWNWLLLREKPRATLWFYPALTFIALAAGQWALARALRRGERGMQLWQLLKIRAESHCERSEAI